MGNGDGSIVGVAAASGVGVGVEVVSGEGVGEDGVGNASGVGEGDEMTGVGMFVELRFVSGWGDGVD